ncbi:hypothetical protein OE88DRAFT_1658896 [Heliocybe sulcata]|uniref:Uncharacterized protein n=1 Tax=Heliocybe sulcata TaxID=5364 RepID=A0A5C3N3Z4_9AGAM|nr:hypothetical protein OE88DRAFT_1658896 [Heliocybe sulcata]
MSLDIMGRTSIILGSAQAVDDLFDRELAKYSDRAHSVASISCSFLNSRTIFMCLDGMTSGSPQRRMGRESR